ncbi:DUF4241 domain-containing protein [Nostoc sp. PCC 7107]|uniref:DUF4241 domain-containing protein n=1 Tax=Nostoc sp. PCC 7107 TaxID=317936 RepID=UPI00029EE9C6|nr:DUF4241 domain-containing protein [Nostoc sp. PCC 7107]AFY41303.1 hypothetical protein Nos7107_0631 [Nostoc sp. PCC 7107]
MDYLKFVQAFQNQQVATSEPNEIIFNTYNIGELVLTSGRLVACDPLVNPDSEPFKVTLNPGRYPVILSVAHFQRNNDRRVVYAMLCLSQQTPVRWEMATTCNEDENLSLLAEGEIFGYGVDSGTGCFMDADAAEIINESMYSAYSTKTRAEDLTYQIECELQKNYSDTWDWANVCVDNSTHANVIAFHSGWGDGIYPTYFGYDATNNIVNVITDFNL